MKAFPENIQFRLKWRPYQKRILDELNAHIDDDRLHVIAPPGSGKTVLGLEVLRRLEQPALVLSPTLTIRDQWVARFLELFMPPDSKQPDWISKDIKNPAFLTVSTYQALHSIYNQEKNDPPDKELRQTKKQPASTAFLTQLIDFPIETIVVDEAHHLKKEWWKSLTTTIDALSSAKVIALTATPPYDVSYQEWERYQSLCGPVDAEISVPELIKMENLAPHQDYVHFSMPDAGEYMKIQEYRQNVKVFFDELCTNLDFIECIESHPWQVDPNANLEGILANPEYFSAMLIFLKHVDRFVNEAALHILSVKFAQIPELDYEWLEILLNNALFNEEAHFLEAGSVISDLTRRLKKISALECRKVRLLHTSKIEKTLSTSISKLQGIVDIVRAEHQHLRQDLRLVILADYIRKSDLPKFAEAEKPIDRIGVAPIFERLRREYIPELRLGILCGSMVAIPERAVLDLKILAAERDLSLDQFKLKPMSHDPGYVLVEGRGMVSDKIVALITELFSEGKIHVLIGTKSLLGEGWDAPAVNSLILATFVGSYVLSNQMRGRAIRRERHNPDKAANIWHLVSVEPGLDSPGKDLETLTRRFRAFVGTQLGAAIRIENGIHRLNLIQPPYTLEKVAKMNQRMFSYAAERRALAKSWKEAIAQGGENAFMVEAVNVPQYGISQRVRRLIVQDTTAQLLRQAYATGCWIFSLLLYGSEAAMQMGMMYILMLVCASLATVFVLPKSIKAARLYLQHGPLITGLTKISNALLDTLLHERLIQTNRNLLKIVINQSGETDVHCHLEGATPYEKTLFLDALQEIVEPVQNPRYLILRRGSVLNGAYAVPEIIGKQKKSAEHFLTQWRKHVGKASLIYTRTISGRWQLVQARAHSLANAKLKKSERVSVWK